MKKLAIIGDPVSHSLSPAIHNFISRYMGIDAHYEAICVESSELGEKIEKIKAEGFSGFNVTSPHKIEICQYLDGISPKAGLYGSVNTVVNRGGRLIGYNTDADGYFLSLKENGMKIEGSHILMLGAGGVSQPVIMMLAQRGASSVTVLNRTREKAERLREVIEERCGFRIETSRERDSYDLVINCTTLGMGKYKDMMPELDWSVVGENTFVSDMIYNPSETLFLSEAKRRGAKTFNGLGMLIYQAVLAYELFLDVKLPEGLGEKVKKEVSAE